MSAYVTDVVRHQLEMDDPAEIVAENEAIHDPLTEAETAAAAADMFGISSQADTRSAPR